MSFPCVERMIRIEIVDEFSSYILRVWQDQTSEEKWDSSVQEAVDQYLKNKLYFEFSHLFEVLSKVPRVSAAEIVDRHGNGQVTYYQWP